jgi:hypothetical protein
LAQGREEVARDAMGMVVDSSEGAKPDDAEVRRARLAQEKELQQREIAEGVAAMLKIKSPALERKEK